MTGPQFKLGQVVATPGALELCRLAGADMFGLLRRHIAADFGDLDKRDVTIQRRALNAEKRDPQRAERMMSQYTLTNGQKLWIITEWDRSATTLLLPEEY